MAQQFHSLLKRQLKKHLPGYDTLSPEIQNFISAVNDAYIQSDEDRRMLERSLDLSSIELMQANAQMRVIFQGVPDQLFLVDEFGTIKDCKIGKDNVLNLRPERLIGRKLAETPLAEFSDTLLKLLHKVLSTGESESVEYSTKIYDDEFFFEARLTPVSDGQVIFIIRDITASKMAELALRMSETKYRTQFETATDAIFIIKDNIFHDCNMQTLQMFGCKREDIIGETPYCFSPEYQKNKSNSKKQALKYIQKALDGKPQMFEWQHCRLDGTVFDAEVNLKRFEIKEDIFLMAIVRDITARKRAQEELAAEKERLAVTLESITDGVIATDMNGTVMLMNRVAELITGWDTATAQGVEIKKVLVLLEEGSGARLKSPVKKVIDKGIPIEIRGNLVLSAKDGIQRDVTVCGAPIRDNTEGIAGVVLVVKDITESKKIEEEIFRARKLDSIGVLAGGIAHDFNNILTGILGNITLAKMMEKNGKSVADKLLNAEKAALRARELTQQFLTFSKGGAPIKQTASIAELIKESIQFILRGSNVKCCYNIPGDLWTVDIDRGQINQVINNMIINADQAMPDGGTISISAENIELDGALNLPLGKGKFIKIIIQDQGVGIADENLKKVFDPYFTTKNHGSGLGLTSSYGIIKKHGGHISVESSIGKGTLFEIYLPASEKEIETEEVETLIPHGKGRIILMDDEDVVRQSAAEQLRQLGYDVNIAANGEELIEMYTAGEEIGENIDLVILDLTIPGGMGGEKTLEFLLEMKPDVKAIVSSGYSNNPIMANYKKHGFMGVVAKPYKIDELSREVYRVIKTNADFIGSTPDNL